MHVSGLLSVSSTAGLSLRWLRARSRSTTARPLHDMTLYRSSDHNIDFPRTFAEILTTVKRLQDAWEIVELEIRNNLMDENLSWIPDCVDTFCQELQQHRSSDCSSTCRLSRQGSQCNTCPEGQYSRSENSAVHSASGPAQHCGNTWKGAGSCISCPSGPQALISC
jgi:hypothetical protein